MNLDDLDLRTLQRECARALNTISGANKNLSKYNKLAHHDSEKWYKAVIADYVDIHGGLPSKVGPGATIKLIHDVQIQPD